MANYRCRRHKTGQNINRELDHSQRFLIASAFRFMRNLLERYQGHLNDTDFFEPVADRLPLETFRRIFNASAVPSLRKKLLDLGRDEKIDLACETPKEVLHKLWEHPACNPKFRSELIEHLRAELLIYGSSLRDDPAPDAEGFAEFQKFFKLSDAETDLILLARLAKGFWECDDLRGSLSYGKFNRLACALGIPESELRSISDSDSRLRKLE